MSLFLILLLFNTCCCQIILQQDIVDDELLSCAATIINDYTKHRTVVFYNYDDIYETMWTKMISKVEGPAMIASKGFKDIMYDKYLLVLFSSNSNRSYVNMLKKVTNKDIIFVLVQTTYIKQQELRDTLAEFQNKIMAYDILMITRVSTTTIKVYTSVVYNSRLCLSTGKPYELCSYTNGKFTLYTHLTKIKRYRNLHGCPLMCLVITKNSGDLVMQRKGVIKLKGRSRKLLDTISEKMNFTPIVKTELSVSDFQNDVFYSNETGKVIIILEKEVDFAIGEFSQMLFNRNNTKIVFGKTLFFECYTWAVPIGAGKKRNLIMNYLNEFELIFWLMFLLFWALSVIVFYCVQYAQGKNIAAKSFYTILEHSYASILGLPILLNMSQDSARILLSSWLFYVLVVRTAYQTKLWSFMTISWHDININSLEDLLDSELSIGGPEELFANLKTLSNFSEDINKLVNRYTVLSNFSYDDAIKRVVKKRDLALLGEKRVLASYLKFSTGTTEKIRNIHIVKGCIMNSFSTPLMFRYNSPMFQPMEFILTTMFESGLLYKDWNILEDGKLCKNTKYKSESKGTMNLDQQIQFLIYGLVLALVVFICEILFYKMHKIVNKYSK